MLLGRMARFQRARLGSNPDTRIPPYRIKAITVGCRPTDAGAIPAAEIGNIV